VNGRATKKPQAESDLLTYYLYIHERNPKAADRFLSATQDAIEKLAQVPGMGAPRDFKNHELAGLRSWPIRGFENYLIFYMPTAYGIDVLRVIHGARDLDRIFAAE
jgi:toxin ParE1/3/4